MKLSTTSADITPAEHGDIPLITPILSMYLSTTSAGHVNIIHRDLSSNICWLKRSSHVKFTEEWVMHSEKYALVKKIFTNGLNTGFPQVWVKTVKWKHNDSQVKKKFWAKQSVKKVMLTVFYDIKKPITVDFLEKGTTVNKCFLLPNP